MAGRFKKKDQVCSFLKKRTKKLLGFGEGRRREGLVTRRVCLGLLLLPAACSVLPARPYQERVEWPLEPALPPSSLEKRRGRRVLLVRDTVGGPGLGRRGLARERADGSLQIDPWNEWAVPPAEAVGPALRAALAASGLFSAVLTPGSRDEADLVLDSELDVFRAAPDGAHAVLSVVLSRNGRPIRQKRLMAVAPLLGNDAADVAAGLQNALKMVLADVVTLLAQTLTT